MARYTGTPNDDAINGAALEANVFDGFGIGQDKVVGGLRDDTFFLAADEKMDFVTGGGGEDRVDYGRSDRGLTIDLSAGSVSAWFGGGLSEVFHRAAVAKLTGIEDATGSHYNDALIGNGADNVFEGGGGADSIQGNGGRDTASYAHSAAAVQIDLNNALQHGGDAEGDQLASIENVIGSANDDHIVGSYSGNNIIEGGDGADYLSSGAYTVVDGVHFNRSAVSYVHSSAGVEIELSQVVQHGGDAEGDQLYGFDNVFGSAFNDGIMGNAANNYLSGGAGNDTFVHTAGSDFIDGGADQDTYLVGNIAGTAGVNIMLDNQTVGYPANPTDGGADAQPASGTYVYFAGGAVDTLVGIENLVGSQNGDSLDGHLIDPAVGTTIHGAGGADTIYGSEGSDHLFGDSGNDTLFGAGGNDFLFGGDDDDHLVGGAGADILDGGAGINTAEYGGSPTGVGVTLQPSDAFGNPVATGPGHGFGGDAAGDLLGNIQNLDGSDHDDVLQGDAQNNVLDGGAGNDRLDGGAGRDTLIGGWGTGNDILTGGHANDRDADLFYFDLYNDSVPSVPIGHDVITDYQPGIDTVQFAHLSSSQQVHVEQVLSDAVVTIDGVDGSITFQHTHAADVHWVI